MVAIYGFCAKYLNWTLFFALPELIGLGVGVNALGVGG
jgi:hypothetical protein